MNMRNLLWIGFVAALLANGAGLSAGAQEAAAQKSAEKSEAKKTTIGLTIELPGEVEIHYKAIPFHEGMTVLDVMTVAAKHARPLQFKQTGSGEFAFLTEMEGVKNGGAEGKNWTYRVDGARAKVGMGSMKLKSGSHVLWLLGS